MATDPPSVPAGQFKARCLELMDQVQARRIPIVITKRGKPVARLVPYDDEPPTLFGYMAGSVTILGDLIEPIGEPWEADA
ncbi:MAG: hypothetical protein JWM80_3705 [Cyanobacteria bacterium RYN_339]|nr:hypothetical protein [Cyanobacteria bacterium RYN_339]